MNDLELFNSILLFDIVMVDENYCDYLRKFDSKVQYNNNDKKRPFVGIIFYINEIEFFAPLASPKKKHLKMKNMMDFIKIDNGKLGAININNMIPVTKNNYKYVDLTINNNIDLKYKKLLLKQLRWLDKHQMMLIEKSYILRDKYMNNELPKRIKDRCCNFPLLEEKCIEYNNKIKVKN